VASRVLEITLTSRNKNDDAPIPMCGVPYRAAQGYIARLIENGYKVAICDQVEDPKAAKGLVKREVVRVVTPGMIIEDELLDEKANNFILAVSRHQQVTGLASLDISTGSFRLTETAESAAIIDEIMRVAPKEILMPESLKTDAAFALFFKDGRNYAVTVMDDRIFEFTGSRQRLLDQFDTLSLEGFGCASMKAGVCAAGALIHYVSETQRQKIDHLKCRPDLFSGEFSCGGRPELPESGTVGKFTHRQPPGDIVGNYGPDHYRYGRTAPGQLAAVSPAGSGTYPVPI
jgi:DNA mismatch repair protein MutS